MTDDLSLSPFLLYARDDGQQELVLFDGDMEDVEDVFDGLDAESNGHGWQSLAQWLVHAEMPGLADEIWFSSESGTFVAGSSDPAALRRLGGRLHAAFHDRALLSRLITEAEPD
ncbi:Imm51 family immunity protein [Catenuloplanes japonicus]|uniref:Imm51 family immunity protein n=1 Tax=Catenuloplanes japonicus TaxID=33876 RepID=UPI00068B2A21|nr:Imm51 family immunity protein [Catenuloplanes japonicus]